MASKKGVSIYNLGTGNGYSVFQVINAFETVSDRQIPYQVSPRRPGDVASCYASPEKAFDELNWKAKRNIEDMVKDTWRWQSKNPNGY